MPTTDIIGYLWSKRQVLDLDGLPDALQMASDLQRVGLEVVRVNEIKILGMVSHTSTDLIRRTPEEWHILVDQAIADATVADFIASVGDGQ